MNERIRELAIQSGAMFDHMTWVERDLAPVFERFAELIVRECLNNMKNCDGDLDFAIWKTKQHFGVEQ
jgi:hypothetical protein